MIKCSTVIALLVMTVPAAAQDSSLVEGFAEGFTFHSIFSQGHKIDSDGATVYANSDRDTTRVATVRAGAAPCVFISTSLNLNQNTSATPVVMLEETYDLRGVTFTANPKHEFAPPGGVYLIMTGPKILCRISTGGSSGKLTRTAQCEDRFEATIEEQMMKAFTATSAKLKASCQWR
jgi:hypothetical protein